MKRPLHPVTNDTACPAYPTSYVDMQAMTALMTATCEFCKERDIREITMLRDIREITMLR